MRRGWKKMDLAELAEAAKNCGLISLASFAAQRAENLGLLLGLAARVKELGGKLNEIPTGPRQSLASLLLARGGYATHNAHAKRLGPEALGWDEWGPGIEADAELKNWAAQLPAGAAVKEGAARALAMYLEARLSKAASAAAVHGADPKAAIFFCANNPDGQRQAGLAVEAIFDLGAPIMPWSPKKIARMPARPARGPAFS